MTGDSSTDTPDVAADVVDVPDLADIMHTLGQIARAVWPRGRMPTAIQVNLLARPECGLDLMVRHEDFANTDIGRITQLLDKVPDKFELPADGLSEQLQLAFWAGYESEETSTEGGQT